MVADSDRGTEPNLLDWEPVSNTHTHTSTRNVYGSTSGVERRSSPHGYGHCEQTPTSHAQHLSYQTDAEAVERKNRNRVADAVDVDAQMIPPPAHITKQSWNIGSASDGDGLLQLLAVALPGYADGLEPAPNTPVQSRSSRIPRRPFNPDPRVADYESAEEVMEVFLNT